MLHGVVQPPACFNGFFPQIAKAIGVLTSNRGEGDEPLWRIGRGTRLQGAQDVVPLLGAIVGCHCSVLWLRGRVTANFGGVDVVPLQGARGEGRPTLGEWTWCHRWVPYKGAIVVCYGWGHFFFTLITQKWFFAIWGLCWYNFGSAK